MIAKAGRTGRRYSCDVEQGVIEDYRRGVLLDEICDRWNLPNKKALYKIIGNEERRIRIVSPQDREAILTAGKVPVRVLAARFGYSKTTIHRIRTSGFDTHDPSEDDAEQLTIGYADTVWRCPEHGKMSVSPCPICAARGVIREANHTKPASTNERKFPTILVAQ